MVWLTLIIGVLNICLGYALAVHLGHGPPGPWEAWEALTYSGSASGGESMVDLANLDSASLGQLLDDDAEDDLDDMMDVESYDETYDDEAAEPEDPDRPEVWDLHEKYVETSLLKLNIAMMKSGARATKLDTQLRECQGHSDQGTIRKVLAELKEDCEAYLEEQGEAAEKFVDRIGELGELSALGEEIEMANLDQSAQVETTLNNLKTMDFRDDLETANHRLLSEIGKLRAVRHRLRDQQERAFLAIARYENRLDNMEQKLFNDALTRLDNRIGLETTLWKWWQKGRHKSHQMSAVLFDLDNFERINEDYSILLGDKVIYQTAQYVRENVAKGDLVARYGGQRFFIMMIDTGPRTATKNVEMLRQSIEKITFVQEKHKICITTTAAITEVLPEDTDEGLLQRLEETLKAAKASGPNRSFFQDGKEPEPVEAPNLGAGEIQIELQPASSVQNQP